MKKYIALVKESAKAENKDFALINSNAKLSIQQSQLDAQKSINQLKSDINSQKSAEFFNPDRIIDLQIRLKVAEEKLSMLNKLDKELF